MEHSIGGDNNITKYSCSNTGASYAETPVNLNGKERTIIYTVDAANLTGSIWGDTGSGNTYGLFNYQNFLGNTGTSTTNRDKITYDFNKTGIIHYAVTLSSSEMKFYVNGTLNQTVSNTIGLQTSNNMRVLAARYADQVATNLKMYNFMIYDRPLTAQEIKNNYEIDKARFNIQ